MPTERELRVAIRLRNNRLVAAREKLGLNQRQLAEQVGISAHSICKYETMQLRPLRHPRGGWKDSALRLAAFFGVSAEYLWPETVLQLKSVQAERRVDVADVRALLAAEPDEMPSPEVLTLQAEQLTLVENEIEDLPENERRVVRAYYGLDGEPRAVHRIAGDMNMSHQGISLILSRAVAKLQHRCGAEAREDVRRELAQQRSALSEGIRRAWGAQHRRRRDELVPDSRVVAACGPLPPEEVEEMIGLSAVWALRLRFPRLEIRAVSFDAADTELRLSASTAELVRDPARAGQLRELRDLLWDIRRDLRVIAGFVETEATG